LKRINIEATWREQAIIAFYTEIGIGRWTWARFQALAKKLELTERELAILIGRFDCGAAQIRRATAWILAVKTKKRLSPSTGILLNLIESCYEWAKTGRVIPTLPGHLINGSHTKPPHQTSTP